MVSFSADMNTHINVQMDQEVLIWKKTQNGTHLFV